MLKKQTRFLKNLLDFSEKHVIFNFKHNFMKREFIIGGGIILAAMIVGFGFGIKKYIEFIKEESDYEF